MQGANLRKPLSPPAFAYALFAAVLFGASTPSAKWLLQGASPWLLAGLLYLGSGVGLGAIRLIARLFSSNAREAPLHGRDWFWLSGATVFGGIIAPLLLMLGLAHSEASTTSLLLNLEGVFTALLAWFAFGENFDRRILTGMLLIVTGGIVLSWTKAPTLNQVLGPLCIAGACTAWAIDNNLTKKVSGSDPLQIAMTKGLVAGLTNTALASLSASAWPPPHIVASSLVVGFLGYGVSLWCFVLSLRHVGAARTGAYFSVAPFMGAMLALASGEPLSAQVAIAGALMALGVWLHISERHDHEHTHEELEHEHLHVHDEHHQHVHAPEAPPGEPHSHRHKHERLVHKHPHFPDLHHDHAH